MENNEKGMVECRECKGTGFNQDNTKFTCQKCCGLGIVDWIENVVGKKKGIKVSPGVHVKEVDLSYRIPSYDVKTSDQLIIYNLNDILA